MVLSPVTISAIYGNYICHLWVNLMTYSSPYIYFSGWLILLHQNILVYIAAVSVAFEYKSLCGSCRERRGFFGTGVGAHRGSTEGPYPNQITTQTTGVRQINVDNRENYSPYSERYVHDIRHYRAGGVPSIFVNLFLNNKPNKLIVGFLSCRRRLGACCCDSLLYMCSFRVSVGHCWFSLELRGSNYKQTRSNQRLCLRTGHTIARPLVCAGVPAICPHGKPQCRSMPGIVNQQPSLNQRNYLSVLKRRIHGLIPIK